MRRNLTPGSLLITTFCLFSAMATFGSSREIASARQFFFDDQIIETLDNTRPRLNPAVKLADNPVIKRDKPWEGSDMRLAWIFFDHQLGKFRMRYSSGEYRTNGRDEKGELIVLAEGVLPGGKRIVCEAFSDDGVNWVKPELGLVEFQGSKANNILPESALYYYIIQDMREPDPAKRYKAQVRVGTYEGNGMTYSTYYSADTYKWTAYENNPIIDTGDQHGRWGPSAFLGWDPVNEVYAVHMENNYHMHSPTHHRRSIGRAESPDMIHWSEPDTIIVVDELDYPDTEFYHLPVSFYEGWHIGLLWVFSTTNTTYEPHFVFSRDGRNYDRTHREPVIRAGDNGDFDSVGVYAQRPIIFDGQVLCYYTGTNWRSPEQLLVLGDKAMAGIGLARLPLDGFVSLEGARDDFSVVTTRSFNFTGKNLFLNMRAALQQWGAEACEVKVEILDGRHAPIEGFAFADADTLSTTNINHPVSWGGKTDVSSLEGRPVRLRIHFRNAKLYAFQFQ
ncbi:MAG: hypothetical protein ACI92G_000703 [Candidatus Pelagisphaera sp.]|jgi:hypothetical protein